jgi:hypothetical protein
MSLSTRTRRLLAVLSCLTAFLSLVPSAVAELDHSFYLPLELKGATQVTPAGINDCFSITGTYLDEGLNQHAFVTELFGKTVSFNISGAFATYPIGINNAGDVTGSYLEVGSPSGGFIRSAKGEITKFVVPGSTATYPAAINDYGVVAGSYSPTDSIPPEYGFIRYPNGTLVTFDLPGVDRLQPIALNNKGESVGFTDSEGAFLRYLDGQIITIDGTVAYGINDAGTIAGWTYAPSGNLGFVRSAGGTTTTFNAPNGGIVYPQHILIDQAGEVVGPYYVRNSTRVNGFLRSCDGRIESFSPPGAVVTIPTGINRFGVITGTYTKADGVLHAFLRIP